MTRRIAVLALLLIAGGAAPLAAQTPPPLPRFSVSVSAGTVLSDSDFRYSITFPLFAETGTIDTTVVLDRKDLFDVEGGVRLWKRLGVGAAFVITTADGALESEITLPNPFLFGDPTRELASASTRQTTKEVLIEALFTVVHSNRWLVVVSGGPSLTYLTQELADDRFRIEYVFPFEQIDVTTSSGDRSSGRATGGHVGGSVTWKASRHIGFDGRLRWSGASVDLEDRNGNQISVDTGGFAIAAGVRFLF